MLFLYFSKKTFFSKLKCLINEFILNPFLNLIIPIGPSLFSQNLMLKNLLKIFLLFSIIVLFLLKFDIFYNVKK